MKTVYFVRHGEYDRKGNLAVFEYPRAVRIGRSMNPKPEIIYTSPVPKMKTTAECIAEGTGETKIKESRILEEDSSCRALALFSKKLLPFLEKNKIDTIAIVSHQPALEKMTSISMDCLSGWMMQKKTWKEIEATVNNALTTYPNARIYMRSKIKPVDLLEQ